MADNSSLDERIFDVVRAVASGCTIDSGGRRQSGSYARLGASQRSTSLTGMPLRAA